MPMTSNKFKTMLFTEIEYYQEKIEYLKKKKKGLKVFQNIVVILKVNSINSSFFFI